MSAHSRLGASAAKRWMTCPGSFRLHDGGAERPSIYAATGSIAHHVAEAVLTGKLRHPEYQLGKVKHHSGYDIRVDEEMIAAVGTYLRVVQPLASRFTQVRFETRVDLGAWWGAGESQPPAPMFGTADCWAFDADTGRLVVVDFKYGSGVFVSIEDNPQLLYYAAGVLAQVRAWGGWVREVELTVVQPRSREGLPVRSATIDVLDLRLWIDRELKPAVQRVTEPNAALVPGAHCRWCSARPTCPARADLANSQAVADFPDDLPDREPHSLDLALRYLARWRDANPEIVQRWRDLS